MLKIWPLGSRELRFFLLETSEQFFFSVDLLNEFFFDLHPHPDD